jgi:hypothetical protein
MSEETKPLTPEERDRLLLRALTRPDSPIVRRITNGIVALARLLKLNNFLPPKDQRALTPQESADQLLAMVWILDKRNSLETVQSAAATGWENFHASIIADPSENSYGFALPVALSAAAQNEMTMTLEELRASDYRYVPKPSKDEGPQPPGKS